MSTFREIISRVDDCKPNAFSVKMKFRWLTQLEGKLAADVFLMNISEIRNLPHRYPEDLNAETLVDYPHDDVYDAWLEAVIDEKNGDYGKYQSSMEFYNETYGNFKAWLISTYEPGQGRQCIEKGMSGYYITAYGLAVMSGFRGSMEEWLLSLRGPKGEAGKSAFQYAKEAGYDGTEEEYAEWAARGGKSAYEYAVEGGYTGTAAEFREKLAGSYAPAVFTYESQNGGDLNTFLNETHLFVFNLTNKPFAYDYGWFDVWRASASGFSPSDGKPIIMQRFTNWKDHGVAWRFSVDAGETFTEWAYENPPCLPGVEYLTTEFYLGEQVKTKVINCGTITGGATHTIAHNTSYSKTVRAEINAGRFPLPYIFNGDPASQYSITGRIDATNIYITAGSGLSAYETYAQIWYI